jgi:hypothetical protein
MNDLNKTMALDKISNIKPHGQTNIWGGIETAVKIITSRTDTTRNTAILLLTDGTPNISPAKGEIDALIKLQEKLNYKIPIYTFGFGYNLQRGLLYDLSKYGNGAVGHISDGGMIATVFCNFTGIVLTTIVNDLILYIKPLQEKYNHITAVKGGFIWKYCSDSGFYEYYIGNVQYQQMRNIIVDFIHFEYYYKYTINNTTFCTEIKTILPNNLSVNNLIYVDDLRFNLVIAIREMIKYCKLNNYSTALQIFNTIKLELINANDIKYDTIIHGFLDNLVVSENSNSGQIFLAISTPEYFNRWGEFYLEQLSCSLKLQIKPNFKDPACQFGGVMFNNIVDNASDIFDTLDPPIPSLLHYKVSPFTNLSAYNNCQGGCFDWECFITMAYGKNIRAKDIKPGDKIFSLNTKNIKVVAIVKCIITTNIDNYINMCVFQDGLKITPWHPIYNNGRWVFPNTISTIKSVYCEKYISFVLDNHHIAFVNNRPVITLGHNYTRDVLTHAYFGSQLVITDLEKSLEWNTGYINLTRDNHTIIRNSAGLVQNIEFK